MNTTLKVFFSVALGSLIGTLVAFELTQYFWWVGALVGGLVGYISYEFKQIVRAVPHAAKKAWNFKPDKELIQKRFFVGLSDTGIFSIGAMLAGLLFSLLVLLAADEITDLFYPIFFVGVPLGFTLLALVYYLINAIASSDYAWREEDGELISVRHLSNKEYFIRFLKYNGITWYLAIPFSPFIGLYYCVKAIIDNWNTVKNGTITVAKFIFVDVWVAIARFFWHLFKLVHSDERAICFVDAIIGSAIGYTFFAEHALLGAIIGGAFGSFNYRVVAKMWLRLPEKDT